MTFTEMLVALGQTLLLAGLCFGVICLCISHLRFQQMTRGAAAGRAPGAADALQVRITRQLGTAHRNPRPFTVMLVAPERWSELVDEHGAGVADEVLASCEQRLRGLLRKTDVVVRSGEAAVGLLLQADRSTAEGVARRVLAEAVRESFRIPHGPALRLQLRAGAAAYPEHGDRAAVLRAQVESALQAARESGATPHWPADAVAPGQPADRAHAGLTEESGPVPSGLLDALTGVLAENQMGPALQKYVAQYRREERPASVLCLDVDFLRRYNDQYGMRTGDQVLKHVAEYLKRHTREEDLIARYGGDQFILALAIKPEQALTVAQRLWAGLRRTPVEGAGPGLRMTVTIGVAGSPGHGLIGRELFEAAQLALRVAKGKGRNQCLLFQASMRTAQAAAEAGDAF